MARQKQRSGLMDNNDELSNIIDDMLGQQGNQQETNPDLPVLEHIITPYDYDDNKKRSLNKARKLLFSLLDFYLTEQFINENQYILHKAKLDETGLSQIITQINYNERAIEIILRSIDAGELSPRIFEVFSMLQRTHIELLKLQSMFMTNMEETIKKVKNDYDFYRSQKDIKTVQAVENQVQNDGIYKGTKELMRQLSSDDDFAYGDDDDEIIDLDD